MQVSDLFKHDSHKFICSWIEDGKWSGGVDWVGKIVVLLYPSTLVIFFYSSVPYFLTQLPHGWKETEVIAILIVLAKFAVPTT